MGPLLVFCDSHAKSAHFSWLKCKKRHFQQKCSFFVTYIHEEHQHYIKIIALRHLFLIHSSASLKTFLSSDALYIRLPAADQDISPVQRGNLSTSSWKVANLIQSSHSLSVKWDWISLWQEQILTKSEGRKVRNNIISSDLNWTVPHNFWYEKKTSVQPTRGTKGFHRNL